MHSDTRLADTGVISLIDGWKRTMRAQRDEREGLRFTASGGWRRRVFGPMSGRGVANTWIRPYCWPVSAETINESEMPEKFLPESNQL